MSHRGYIKIVGEREPRAEGVKMVRVKVVCMECGKKFAVGPKAVCPQCPKCGGVDVEVR